MKREKYLPRIKKTDTIPGLINEIKSVFNEFETPDYLPAIIEEGEFIKEQGEDFYLKLVLKHYSIELNKTWLKNNLEFNLEEPTVYDGKTNDSAFIHNVIIYRRYKSRDLYQLNPLILPDEVNEFEYTNSSFVNAYYNEEYSNVKGQPVLKYNNDNNLLVFKKVFNDYLNDPESNIYPKFELVAEFEYRTHKNHFSDIKTEQCKYKDAFVDINKSEDKLYILGSIIIPLNGQKRSYENRNIQVIDLHKLESRNHNASHYNGDTIEGFICFKPEVVEVIKDYYYFYDLQIIDKSNIQNSYLVDTLEDKIVFWEAEYNKLPMKIKDIIDPYNFVPKNKTGLISEAMSAMQLEVDWNWDKKLPPEYLLANLIRERIFNRAIDIGLTFIQPKNLEELRDFIIKVESLTGIKLERFNTKAGEVISLINIREGSKKSINRENIKLLYKKYCFAIHMEYKKK